jgi:tetratricopeptide (TPR) repeat protein
MYADPVLKKALVLTRRRKYEDAIKLLEPEVFRYQDSYSYYHVLGLSCLYGGDLGGAFTYFNRAKNIKFREVPTLLGLAVHFLSRNQTDHALDLYLEVQDIEPSNRIAKRALKIIKKYGGTEELNGWIVRGKISCLYPPIPWAGFSVRPLPVIITGIALATIIGVFIGFKQLPVFQRKGIAETNLEKSERENPVEKGGFYRYILTVDEVLAHYNKARVLFNARRDEAAKKEINTILESNASVMLKNKARLLLSYTETPGFDTLKDKFSYAEVAADPILYRDCHVLWRGSAANVRTASDIISFDFLVGYDTRTVLEGYISVELSFAADINTSETLEVLGRVVPLSSEKFKLAATTIHQMPKN